MCGNVKKIIRLTTELAVQGCISLNFQKEVLRIHLFSPKFRTVSVYSITVVPRFRTSSVPTYSKINLKITLIFIIYFIKRVEA